MAYQVTIYNQQEKAARRDELQRRAERAGGARFRHQPAKSGWLSEQLEGAYANFGRPQGNLVSNAEWASALIDAFTAFDLPVADKLRLLEAERVYVNTHRGNARSLQEWEQKRLIKALRG